MKENNFRYITKKDYKNFITCKFFWQLEQEVEDINFFNDSNKTTFAKKKYHSLLDEYEVSDEVNDTYMKEGLEFDILVKQLFSQKYETLNLNDEKYKDLSLSQKAKLTREAIDQKNVQYIINGWFIFNDLICNPDLIEVIDKSEIVLIEIKGRKKVDNSRDISDLAFQYYLITKLKIKIENVKVVLLSDNFFYTRLNNYNEIYKFVHLVSINRKIYSLLDAVFEQSLNISNVLIKIRQMAYPVLKEPLPRKIHNKCYINGEYCKYFKFCAKHINNIDIGENSLLNLYNLKFDKKIKILNDGFYHFQDYPTFKDLLIELGVQKKVNRINTIRELQYLATVEDRDIVDHFLINEELKRYKGPIYMLDFETFAVIIPKILFTGSYQQVPFLYSIHIINDFDCLKEENKQILKKKIVHKTHIEDPNNFQLLNFLSHLSQDLRSHGDGTIVAYHASFEISVIKNLIMSCEKI
ncbi:DUF2779 domain-containing protein [Mycoplasma sp. SG1]|uniref:DUF2779 domain-containing protein n=1 Tax=Mycoplasma sp. SG1 TaxID=2810348 RepID=UPI0020259E79|nr:DUF2779 domain-containing protein [Mycoplasma sp. SG1]URM53093.1 DUF2779 domain-containing protein [Mycoplasma sp. SG1]